MQLKSSFKDDEHLYYVFEYCPHGNINELAEQFPEGRLPLDICAYYTAQIILFLDGLHSQGLVHRDLKPENIMIDKNMHIKIIDFGDVKYVDEDKNVPYVNEMPSKYQEFSDLEDSDGEQP